MRQNDLMSSNVFAAILPIPFSKNQLRRTCEQGTFHPTTFLLYQLIYPTYILLLGTEFASYCKKKEAREDQTTKCSGCVVITLFRMAWFKL
jgi:hypothetical protein